MGFTVNRRAAEIYGKLLVLYPANYRKRYSDPMVQTFDDMLKGEDSHLGKAVIWLRALLDLPMSAVKEHLTSGKGLEMKMSRNVKILFSGVVLVLLLANGFSWWFGNLHSRQTSGISQVSVAQIAEAMQDDHFFNSYGNTTLLFRANVADIQSQSKGVLVTFQSNQAYSVSCLFPDDGQIGKGSSLSVAAPGGSAERQPHGVLLHKCVTN